jgi:hypothetical protein
LLRITSYRLLSTLPLLALIYLPFISGGLLTDDFAHVVRLSTLDSAVQLIDAPDAFGFYRPVTQVSLALAPGARGERLALARAINVALHASVIALAFLVSRLVLQSVVGAGLATLCFVLTPKAPSIAVLWISARGELLMALFTLASIAAWIAWTRNGRGWWLAGAIASYGLALLSKETATLLPLMLLVTPRPERRLAARAGAVAGFVALALVIYAWRTEVGALTPFSGDAHYSPALSVALWTRNATNYLGRMIVAPSALLVLLGLARLTEKGRSIPFGSYSILIPVGVLTFAAAFVVVFLAPVLPIALRSELYLYLPVFGVCLVVGWLGSLLVQFPGSRRSLGQGGSVASSMIVAVALYIVGLGSYQIARARDIQQDLRFSETLVGALRDTASLAETNRSVVLVPADHETERSLQSAIGGYLYVVLQYAFASPPRAGAIEYSGEPRQQADLRLICSYRKADGAVSISPAQ